MSGQLNSIAEIFSSHCSIRVYIFFVFKSRQRCLSLVNLSFRLGCLVNTLVPANPDGAISLAAMVIYSSGPIICCGLCLLLPETSGVPLPDSVADCNRQLQPHQPAMDALWRTEWVLVVLVAITFFNVLIFLSSLQKPVIMAVKPRDVHLFFRKTATFVKYKEI